MGEGTQRLLPATDEDVQMGREIIQFLSARMLEEMAITELLPTNELGRTRRDLEIQSVKYVVLTISANLESLVASGTGFDELPWAFYMYGLGFSLKPLALRWAYHEDYNPEWLPEGLTLREIADTVDAARPDREPGA